MKHVEEIIIRGQVYQFEFDRKPTEEELIKAISTAIEGIGGRPADRKPPNS